MKEEVAKLAEEIRQLTIQYREEVPGGRRAWPEAIKSRVSQLCGLGLTAKEISHLTHLSYFTILGWVSDDPQYRKWKRKSKVIADGHFVPVEVRASRKLISTVTVPNQEVYSQIATVTVTLPGGVRIEGVTAEFLRSWLGQLAEMGPKP